MELWNLNYTRMILTSLIVIVSGQTDYHLCETLNSLSTFPPIQFELVQWFDHLKIKGTFNVYQV